MFNQNNRSNPCAERSEGSVGRHSVSGRHRRSNQLPNQTIFLFLFFLPCQNMKVLKIWVILWGSILSVAESFLFDLDLAIDSSLHPGGSLSKNKGSYLMDSFRTDVIGPAINSMVKELKSNRRSDIITEGVLFLFILILGGFILALWLRVRNGSEVKEIPPQVQV